MNEATQQRRHWHLLPKWLRRTIIVALIAVLVLFAGNIIINRVIEHKVASQLQQFSPNISARFSAVHANFLASSLAIEDAGILVKPTSGDTIHKPYIHFGEISISGISFFKLVFSQEVSINTLKLDKGDITVDQSFFDTMDSTGYDIKSKQDFKRISIGHFIMSPANFWLKNDTGSRTLLDGSLYVDEINIGGEEKKQGNRFSFGGMGCDIHNIRYSSTALRQAMQIKKLAVNSKLGTLGIDSISAAPFKDDSAKNMRKTQDIHVETSIAGIKVSGLDFMQLKDKKFIATAVVINESNTDVINKMTATGDPGQMIDSLKKMMPEISIDTLRINRASLAYHGDLPTAKNAGAKEDHADTQHISIKHFEIDGSRITMHGSREMTCNIDTVSVSNINVLKDSFKFNGIECHVSKLNYVIPGAYHNLYIDRVVLSSRKQLLHISAAKILPQCTKLQLGEKLGHQADYVEASVGSMDITALDVMQLAAGKLTAGNIRMDGCKAYIFRDRRLTRLQQPQPLPVTMLNQLSMQVNVRRFTATHVGVAYEEFPKDGTQTGTLKIERGQVEISPLFNHAHTGHLDMVVKGSIMGSGTVEGNIYMPMQDSNYHIKGMIKDLELTALQSSAENLGKFHIQSGILNSLFFEFTMDEKKSSGKIIGVYHDLVLEKLKGNDKKVAIVPTLALKGFIIPKNKDASKPERNRTGTVDYTRDNTRSVSFDLIKSLLSGIRDSFTFGFLLPK